MGMCDRSDEPLHSAYQMPASLRVFARVIKRGGGEAVEEEGSDLCGPPSGEAPLRFISSFAVHKIVAA